MRLCRKEWKENFEAAGREEWWTAFLAHPTAGAVKERTVEAGKQGVALPESAVQA